VLRRHGPRVPRAGGPRVRPPLRPAPAASALACRRQTSPNGWAKASAGTPARAGSGAPPFAGACRASCSCR